MSSRSGLKFFQALISQLLKLWVINHVVRIYEDTQPGVNS